MQNVFATHIPENQKDELLRRLRLIEENIIRARGRVVEGVKDTETYFYAADNVGAYAARLNGLIQRRDGFCESLRVLGFRVTWDGEHPVDIVIDTID